jgi:glycerol-3-phosphate dehydrogenase (NAD(P)+)
VKLGVIGAGSWGTALAILAAGRGNAVRLWGHDPGHIDTLRRTGKNEDYLPGVELPGEIEPVADLAALAECEAVLFVIPSGAIREVAEKFAACGPRREVVLVSCTKGIERSTGVRMSEVLGGIFSNPIAVLSGPSHAEEVARGMPAAVVLGCRNEEVAERLQQGLSARTFRVYRSDDVAGIELGGALKNVFAIGAGVCDGLGLGDNAKAALITRSLAELIRLGLGLGGRRETFQGLSGIGDLMVTCFSRHSRNRSVGERLGRGESIEAVSGSMRMVAEGVPNTLSAYECARRLGIETPIIDAVKALLYEKKAPREALLELMTREPRPEEDR